MDGLNVYSKEKEKEKKGCLIKISNFIIGLMEKGFYRLVKFFLFICKFIFCFVVFLVDW